MRSTRRVGWPADARGTGNDHGVDRPAGGAASGEAAAAGARRQDRRGRGRGRSTMPHGNRGESMIALQAEASERETCFVPAGPGSWQYALLFDRPSPRMPARANRARDFFKSRHCGKQFWDRRSTPRKPRCAAPSRRGDICPRAPLFRRRLATALLRAGGRGTGIARRTSSTTGVAARTRHCREPPDTPAPHGSPPPASAARNPARPPPT
jgi:hypothetical protein